MNDSRKFDHQPDHIRLHTAPADKLNPKEGAFWYGPSRYPIEPSNLATLGIDRAELAALLEPLLKRLDRLSGGHPLDRHPIVDIALSGSGYTLEFREEL